MGWIHNANATVARSPIGRYFRLEGSGVSTVDKANIVGTDGNISIDVKGRGPISSPKYEPV